MSRSDPSNYSISSQGTLDIKFMKTKIFVKLFTITFTLTFRIIFENVLIAKCLRKVLENIGYIGGGGAIAQWMSLRLHLEGLGLNTKRTIYAFAYSLILYHFVIVLRKGRK